MCGRFKLNVTPAKVKEYYDLTSELNFAPFWNIAPATPINTIIADKDENRHLKLMHWSLIPSWEKDKNISNRLINARSETIIDKPSLRVAFRHRRCIIPAT